MCHPTAHIVSNEPGSTSLFASGAQMLHVRGDGSLIDPDELHRTLEHFPWRDPHNSQPSVISVTQPTDFGSVYDLSHLAKLTSIAQGHGLRGHLDGARFANALVHLDCSPADATWRSGIDVLTLGATKNGGLSAELIVSFDDAASEESGVLFYRISPGIIRFVTSWQTTDADVDEVVARVGAALAGS